MSDDHYTARWAPNVFVRFFAPARFRALVLAMDVWPRNEWVREQWVLAALEVIAGHCTGFVNEKELGAARQVMDALGQLARDHGDEPELRERWAMCFVIYGRVCTSIPELDVTLQFFETLKVVAEAYPDEICLRHCWARALGSVIGDLCFFEEFEPAFQLMKVLEGASKNHLNDPVLRYRWAWALMDLAVGGACWQDLTTTVEHLSALEVLSQAHLDEPELGNLWMSALRTVVLGAWEEDAPIWVAVLRELAQKYPAVEFMQEIWVEMDGVWAERLPGFRT